MPTDAAKPISSAHGAANGSAMSARGRLVLLEDNEAVRVAKVPIPRCRFLSKPVDTKALLAAVCELGEH